MYLFGCDLLNAWSVRKNVRSRNVGTKEEKHRGRGVEVGLGSQNEQAKY